MSALRQIRSALVQGFTMAMRRPRHTLLMAAGFFIASATLVGLLTIPAGLRHLSGQTGLADVAVIRTGHRAHEATGGTSSAQLVQLLGNLPGVAKWHHRFLVAPQFVANIKLRRRNGIKESVQVHGVGPLFWKIVGDHVQVSPGRKFKPGLDELIAGRGVGRTFVGLDPGGRVLVRKRPWAITGILSANHGLWESQLWTGIHALQDAFNARGHVSTIWVKLTSPDVFPVFAAALHRNPGLKGLVVERQPDFYRFQVGFIYRYTLIASWSIATVLGLGAALAIANALHMVLLARRRELAVLRALGFTKPSLALALMVEVVATGALCAGLVIVVGWLVLNGHTVDTSTFLQSATFSLRVDAAIAFSAVAYVAVLGILASIFPVSRELRVPLTRALAGK